MINSRFISHAEKNIFIPRAYFTISSVIVFFVTSQYGPLKCILASTNSGIHGLFGSLDFPRILSSFDSRSVFAPDQLGYGAYREIAPDSWSL